METATYQGGNDDLARVISRDSHKYQGVTKRYKILKYITSIAITDDYDLDDTAAIIKKAPGLDNALQKILNSDSLQDILSDMENSHD